MSPEKREFAEFLKELGLPAELLSRFEAYHKLLEEQNRMVNLVSRAEPSEKWWTKHFLDSLLLLKCLDLTGQKALDFGSGAGLPGIPLKLAVPSIRITLLDSIGKKARAMQTMTAELGLDKVHVVNARLEDHATQGIGYDLILCRAVKMEERYRYPLYRLLNDGGKVVFFKAIQSSDLDDYQPKLLLKEQHPWGSRSLWEVSRKALA
ncbi:MAG: 16S rRNA (guanine(527)-N(7))-methyltransferase RsmG [Candidatus Cloacimonadaceae bacterium]